MYSYRPYEHEVSIAFSQRPRTASQSPGHQEDAIAYVFFGYSFFSECLNSGADKQFEIKTLFFKSHIISFMNLIYSNSINKLMSFYFDASNRSNDSFNVSLF